MRNALFIFLIPFFFVACGEPIEKDSEDKLVLTYSMECSGQHRFDYNNIDDLCSQIANDGMNKGCDRDFRKKLYEEVCPGRTFPHKVTSERPFQFTYTYEKVETNCTTGKHYFFYETPARLQNKICFHLLNDDLNNYCAVESRRQTRIDLACE